MKSLVVLVAFKVALVLANDLEEFVISNREFSANFYNELATKITGDFVGCPISAEIVLGMIHAGAKNRTAQQLSTGLSLPNSISKIKSVIEVALPKLKSQPERYTLKTINKMYVSHDLRISNDFNATAKHVFNTDVESVNFKKKDNNIPKINAWVGNSTEEQIKHLLELSDVTENTKAILLNAQYFQGTWHQKFSKKRTKRINFFTDETRYIKVDMMEAIATFEYHKCGYFKAKFLRMPYVGTDSSMVVILPDEIDGLGRIEANIHKVLEVQKFAHKTVHVKFPKFKIDSTVKLVPVLEELGIVDLFKPSADLSGITFDATEFYINNVIQKNTIGVDEDGTNADSAVTPYAKVDVSLNAEPSVEYFVHHPFIFYVESPAGIIFIGRYAGQ